MATFSEQVQSFTQNYLAPKAVDIVFSGNVLALRLLSNAKPWRGRNLEKTIIFGKKGNGKSFTGMEQFNTNKPDTKRKLSFDPRAFQEPVVIDGIERDVTASDPNASIELVTGSMEEAAINMGDALGDIFYGDGTGSYDAGAIVSDSSNKNFLGLEAIIDDGGEVGTYGGLSRGVYTDLKANEYDVSGAVTLDDLATATSGASRGTDKVTLNVTTEAKWDEYESILQATVQHNQPANGYRQVTRDRVVEGVEALKGSAGFDALFYRGKPVVADEKCPTNKWYGINERHIGFYSLKSAKKGVKPITVGGEKNIEGVYGDMGKKQTGFFFTGLMDPINQYGEVGHMLLLGNLVSFNPNRHFVINFS